jgi:hypothetical protein
MAKLNQVIAIEKGIKSRTYGELTELNKAVQKPELFNGFSKTYEKKEEADETLPAESKRVQFTAPEVLRSAERLMSELINTTARKDYTNCAAAADVLVDGEPIMKNAPVSFLLFMEKQLTDLRTFIGNLPVLDSAEDWNKDPNSGLYKTRDIQTHRTKKVVKPIVLYPATEQHPAQTQLISEDVIAGFWNHVKHSGAMPLPEKQKKLAKVEKLLQAIKQAREEANGQEEVNTPEVGKAVFNYILGE